MAGIILLFSATDDISRSLFSRKVMKHFEDEVVENVMIDF